MKPKLNIMWFRRDLRLTDNAALYHALKADLPVLPVFIFDTNILRDLPKKDKRVRFIHDAIVNMQQSLKEIGSTLQVFHDTPAKAFETLLEQYDIDIVFTNHDYEQYAIDRDQEIATLVKKHHATLHTYKDQVIFDKEEVLKDDSTPYTIFTPYSRKWKAKLNAFYLKSYPSKKYFHNFYQHHPHAIPSLQQLGFENIEAGFPSSTISKTLLHQYKDQRDFPGIEATSHLGIHLRFGTISIRALAAKAMKESEVFLNELIWRDFYHMILWHFPHVRMGHSFKQQYDHIRWRNNEKEFELWCEGQTGYPIVDAGMRELNTTGFMHNRVRMIVASFLTKHLLIDWRWGEAYFAERLLDYDYAANNGGWQWAAGSGCDAAPYFRVFNPTLQTKKFDPSFEYIRKWVPEFESLGYVKPVVEHEFARKRALEVYGKALKPQ